MKRWLQGLAAGVFAGMMLASCGSQNEDIQVDINALA